MLSKTFNIIVLFLLVCLPAAAQRIVSDSTMLKTSDTKRIVQTTENDSIVYIERKKKDRTQDTNETITLRVDSTIIPVQNVWKPNPLKAVWRGAVIPGYGQIYNRKYWKLPIVYGGFMGCAYAITWNGTMYSSYRSAYFDISDNDPTTNSYLDILPEGYTMENLGGEAAFKQILETKYNSYRRYRDMSILATMIFYALTLVDAYVDAELYDFDISPDLSIQLQPALYHDQFNSQRCSAELQMSLTF